LENLGLGINGGFVNGGGSKRVDLCYATSRHFAARLMLEFWHICAVIKSGAVLCKNSNDVHLKLEVEHCLLFAVWPHISVKGEIRGTASTFEYGTKAECIWASAIVEFVNHWEGPRLYLCGARLSLFNKNGRADVDVVITEVVRATCYGRGFIYTALS
jgi:hypothetical protein